MAKPTLIVIGNGMAGIRLVEHLCKFTPDRYRILIIGDENYSAYNRIQLTPVLSGEKDFEQIMTHDAQWYEHHNITFLAGVTATAVDRHARTVTAAGQIYQYDHLVIATGSRPFLPSLPGMELPGIQGFRTQQDVENILRDTYTGQPMVVIGGGVLGVEAAAALALRGMQVTLLHRGPHLMDQQLDEQAGDLLYDRLALRGINVILQAETASFAPDTTGNLHAIHLRDGREIPAERAVIAVGVRPEIGLAKDAGLACDRGILVNNQLQTSDPQISAIGECCQLGDATFGLVAPCWQQAEMLASRLAGIDNTSTFELQNVPLRLKVTGIDLFCAGELHANDDAQIHTTFDPFDGHYRRLVLRNNQVKGVLLWGDIRDGPDYLLHISHPAALQASVSVFSPAHEPESSGLPSNQSEPLPVAVT